MASTLLPLSLETLIYDLQRSIAAKLYYPALLVTLTLPEVCVGLTMPRSQFVKQKHYVDWVDRYCFKPECQEETERPYLGVTGAECYLLRGGLVHRGDLRGHAYFGGTHVIFTTPETQSSIHASRISTGEKSALMLDLVTFCHGMVGGVRKWYDENQESPLVAEGLKSIIRFCPNGVSPFFVGAPVVASGE